MSENVEDLQKTALDEKQSVELKTPVSDSDSTELTVVANHNQLATSPQSTSLEVKSAAFSNQTSSAFKASPPPGMLRRRLTLVATALLALGVFAFNMTDMQPLIEQAGTIDKNFVFTPEAAQPELPLGYRYVYEQSPAKQELSAVRFDKYVDGCLTSTYGFADAHGHIAIPPVFAMARSFSEGLCAVQDSSRNMYWSYIDRKGELVMRPLYDSAGEFSNGRAVVTQLNRRFIIDMHGGILPPGECNYIDDYPGDRYVVSKAKSNHYGVMKGSTYVIPEIYDGITALKKTSNPLYLVLRKGSQISLADSNGKIYFSKNNCTICGVNGSLVQTLKDGRAGFCDLSGNYVVEPKYKLMTAPDKLIAVTDKSKKIHFVNAQGKDVPSVAVDSVVVETPVSLKWLHDGLGLFRRNGLYGYLDQNGKEVIPPTFLAASSFHDGLACVNLGSRKAFIDKAGTIVNDNRYLDAKSFHNGKAEVKVPGLLSGVLQSWSNYLKAEDRHSHVNFMRASESSELYVYQNDPTGTTFGTSPSLDVFESE